MPLKPKQICRNPNCNRKVSGTYCREHKKEQKQYGYSSKMDPWYNKAIWRGSNPNAPLGQRGGLRECQLLTEPYCRKCKEKKGIINDVTGTNKGVADHVIPFRSAETEQKQWELFTDFDNLQTLCRSCDAKKSQKDGQNR